MNISNQKASQSSENEDETDLSLDNHRLNAAGKARDSEDAVTEKQVSELENYVYG